ncbi:MAG: hypothetical protein K0R50_1257 [Eubacterium sp.]|nr:hypothetical protein [Eubacterium sp.]
MDNWQKKNVLMVVKTYPTPSTKYQETVCTAGITEDGQWIRLYPVKFRNLNPEQKFEKFCWIEIDTIKNTSDFRPESFKANADSLKIIRKLDSKVDLEERKNFMLPLVSPSMEYIKSEYDISKKSLGIFKPKIVKDIKIVSDSEEWTQEQKNKMNQLSFLDTETKPLEKIPWEFSFQFECDNPDCKGHKMKITDWEFCQAFRNFRRIYKSDEVAHEKLKEKYLGFFNDERRDSYIIVGTVHPHPTFIIIGIFTYLKDINNKTNKKIIDGQLPLF